METLHKLASRAVPEEHTAIFQRIKDIDVEIDYTQGLRAILDTHKHKILEKRDLFFLQEALHQHFQDTIAICDNAVWARKIDVHTGFPVLATMPATEFFRDLNRHSMPYCIRVVVEVRFRDEEGRPAVRQEENIKRCHFRVAQFLNENCTNFTYSNHQFLPYSPRHGMHTFGGPRNCFNTFMGFIAQRGHKERVKQGSPTRDHPTIKPICDWLYDYVCGVDDVPLQSDDQGGLTEEQVKEYKDSLYSYLIGWLAMLVQQPALNNMPLMVWQSNQKGVAKTLFWAWFALCVIGEWLCKEITERHALDSKWTDNAPGCMLRTMDDVSIKSKNFNGSTTALFENIERKHQHPQKQLRTCRDVVLTNDQMPTSDNANDRKVFYLMVSSVMNVRCPEGKAYVDNLRKNYMGLGEDKRLVVPGIGLRSGQVFYDYLMGTDVSGWSIDTMPLSYLALRVKQHTEEPTTAWLRHMLYQERDGTEFRKTPMKTLFDDYRAFVFSLEQEYNERKKRNPDEQTQTFFNNVRDFCRGI